MDKYVELAVKKSEASGLNRVAQAILAGVFISFGCMAMGVIKADPRLSPSISYTLSGLVFSVGLFSIVTIGGQLFTGNCLMFLAAFKEKLSYKKCVKLLCQDLFWNFVGASIMSFVIYLSGFNRDVFGNIMIVKTSFSGLEIMMRSILCNMFVCLAVLISWNTKSIVGKFFAVLFPVMTFVMCGFEHSIADIFFMYYSYESVPRILAFIVLVIMGNHLGGFIFSLLVYLGFNEFPETTKD